MRRSGPGGPTPLRCSPLWPTARNSLRSLRSLCSINRAGSEVEAREYTRGPQGLRCSAPHMRATAGPHRPLRNRSLCSAQPHPRCMAARCLHGGLPPPCREAAGGGPAGRMGGAEQRRVGVGACTHALPELTREHCLSATSAASEASCERDPDPSSAGNSGPQGPTAADKPRRAPARGLARATRRTHRSICTSAGTSGRTHPQAHDVRDRGAPHETSPRSCASACTSCTNTSARCA